MNSGLWVKYVGYNRLANSPILLIDFSRVYRIFILLMYRSIVSSRFSWLNSVYRRYNFYYFGIAVCHYGVKRFIL